MSHNPKARGIMLSHILDSLYVVPSKLYLQQVHDLVPRNSALFGNSQELLQFEGKVYGTSPSSSNFRRGVAPVPLNKLHPSLRDELRKILREREEIRREKSVVTGYIQKVLMVTDDISDYGQLFPEAMHKTIRGCTAFFEGPCKSMSPQFLAAFVHANERYINAMKLRLMTNFIERT
jgi:hypothetical protein